MGWAGVALARYALARDAQRPRNVPPAAHRARAVGKRARKIPTLSLVAAARLSASRRGRCLPVVSCPCPLPPSPPPLRALRALSGGGCQSPP